MHFDDSSDEAVTLAEICCWPQSARLVRARLKIRF